MSSIREWSDDAGALRRFGLALARDDRFVCDDAAAAALVDKLFRQASLTLIDEAPGEPRSARVGAFAQFIRLYRRHVRAMAAEDAEGGWAERARRRAADASVTSGVRDLPLELRETLLLVVLAGFSHAEAAEALDIPLAAVLDRLGRARARLGAHMEAARGSAAQRRRGRTPRISGSSSDAAVRNGRGLRLRRQLPRPGRSAGVRGAAARGRGAQASGRAVAVAEPGDPRRLRRAGVGARSDRSRQERQRELPADATTWAVRPRPSAAGRASLGPARAALPAASAPRARRAPARRGDRGAGGDPHRPQRARAARRGRRTIDRRGRRRLPRLRRASDAPVEFRDARSAGADEMADAAIRQRRRRVPRILLERAGAAGRAHRAGDAGERRLSRLRGSRRRTRRPADRTARRPRAVEADLAPIRRASASRHGPAPATGSSPPERTPTRSPC